MSLSGYPDLDALVHAWSDLADRADAEHVELGRSTEGRALVAYRFGSRSPSRTVMLSGLVHGDELIGGLGLLESMRHVVRSSRALLEEMSVLVLPVVNPDGVARTFERLRRGAWVGHRRNARGVDLNRNFGVVSSRRFLHPFAGSRVCKLPHYMGPRAFSEPETRAVRRAVRRYRPTLSVGFHSFGNLLLYPWSFTKAPSKNVGLYRRLGEAFARAQARPYTVAQSCGLYPTLGDLDDWLESKLDIRALTLEVSRPDPSLFRSFGFLKPIHWMNPKNVAGTLENVVPGVRAILATAACPTLPASGL